MKIVNRKEFLTLPVGTVYSHYEPCAFRDLAIKGESITNDWFFVSLEGSVDSQSSGEMFDRCSAMAERGESFPVDFDTEGRDGSYDPDETLYAVYEPGDVEKLIARLQMALRNESVYTIEKKNREGGS